MDIDALVAMTAEDATPLIRTDFSDDARWAAIVAAVTAPVDFGGEPDDELGEDDGYTPHLGIVDDRSFEQATVADIVHAAGSRRAFLAEVLLADSQAMHEVGSEQDPTLVYLYLGDEDEDAEEDERVAGRAFRCAIGEVASIEVNLSISNVDFHEFADYADEHGGVFRGFDE